MGAVTKAELEALVKRLQTKNATLTKSLERTKAKNKTFDRSLAEAHEREKATAEILRLNSRSPTAVQPVFDGIAKAAVRLIGGVSAAVTRTSGDTLHLAALTSTSNVGDELLNSQFPCPVSKLPGHARALQVRTPYCVSDTEKVPRIRDVARARGYRSAIFVPLLRDKVPIGTIGVSRRDPGMFSVHDIELLQTFADQAVIAIENGRLFKELQVRNAETTGALQQQTATAEILQVISSSPRELQPVFDAILEKQHSGSDPPNASIVPDKYRNFRYYDRLAARFCRQNSLFKHLSYPARNP